MAQDAAMREKRRALSRSLASALDDMATVYGEFAFLRDLADIQPLHVRILEIMRTRPTHLDQVAEQMNRLDDELAVRQWKPWALLETAPDWGNVIPMPMTASQR